jgi:hypothetical protein
MAQGLGEGLIQELAIADGASATAKAAPIGREGLNWPAELISGDGNGLIRSTGTAMEEEMDRATTGVGKKLTGDQGHGPSQITAAAGHDHQGTGRGHHRQRWRHGRQRRGEQCSGLAHCRGKEAHGMRSKEKKGIA